jgi:hypothetical protein
MISNVVSLSMIRGRYFRSYVSDKLMIRAGRKSRGLSKGPMLSLTLTYIATASCVRNSAFSPRLALRRSAAIDSYCIPGEMKTRLAVGGDKGIILKKKIETFAFLVHD